MRKSIWSTSKEVVPENGESAKMPRRLPVRIPSNLMSGSTSKGFANHGGTVRREPIRIGKTPQNRKVVRRNIIGEIGQKSGSEVRGSVAMKFAQEGASTQHTQGSVQTPASTVPSRQSTMHTRTADTVAVVSAAALAEVAAFPPGLPHLMVPRIEAPRTPILLTGKKPSAETIRVADAFIARSQRALDMDTPELNSGRRVASTRMISGAKKMQTVSAPVVKQVDLNCDDAIASTSTDYVSTARAIEPQNTLYGMLGVKATKDLQATTSVIDVLATPPVIKCAIKSTKDSPMLESMRKSLATVESINRPIREAYEVPSIANNLGRSAVTPLPVPLATKQKTVPLDDVTLKIPVKNGPKPNIYNSKSIVNDSTTLESSTENLTMNAEQRILEAESQLTEHRITEVGGTASPTQYYAIARFHSLVAEMRMETKKQEQRMAELEILSAQITQKHGFSKTSRQEAEPRLLELATISKSSGASAPQRDLVEPETLVHNQEILLPSKCGSDLPCVEQSSICLMDNFPCVQGECEKGVEPKMPAHGTEILPIERRSSRLEDRRQKRGANTPSWLGGQVTKYGCWVTTPINGLTKFQPSKSTTPVTLRSTRAKSEAPTRDISRERRAKTPTPIAAKRGRPRRSRSPTPVPSRRSFRAKSEAPRTSDRASRAKTPTPVASKRGRPWHSKSPPPVASRRSFRAKSEAPKNSGRASRAKTPTPVSSNRGRPRRSKTPTPIVSRRATRAKSEAPRHPGRASQAKTPTPVASKSGMRGRSQSPTPIGSGRRPGRSQSPTPMGSGRRPGRSQSPKPMGFRRRPGRSQSPTPMGSGRRSGRSQSPTPMGSGRRPGRSQSPTPMGSGRRPGRSQSPTPMGSGRRSGRSQSPTPMGSGRRPGRSQSPTPMGSGRRPGRSQSPTPMGSGRRPGRSQSPTPMGSGRRPGRSQSPTVMGSGKRHRRSQSPTPVMSRRATRAKSEAPRHSGRASQAKTPTPVASKSGIRGRSQSPTPMSSGGRTGRSQYPTHGETGRRPGRSQSPTPGGSGRRPGRSHSPTPGGSGRRSERSQSPTPGGSGRRPGRSQSPTPGGSGRRPGRSQSPTPVLSKCPIQIKIKTTLDLKSTKRPAIGLQTSPAKRLRATAESPHQEVLDFASFSVPLKHKMVVDKDCDSPLALPLNVTDVNDKTLEEAQLKTTYDLDKSLPNEMEYNAQPVAHHAEPNEPAKNDTANPPMVTFTSSIRSYPNKKKDCGYADSEHSYSRPPWAARSLVADYHSFTESPSQGSSKSGILVEACKGMHPIFPNETQVHSESAEKIDMPIRGQQESPKRIEIPNQVQLESPVKIEMPNQLQLESLKNEISNQFQLVSQKKIEIPNQVMMSPRKIKSPIQVRLSLPQKNDTPIQGRLASPKKIGTPIRIRLASPKKIDTPIQIRLASPKENDTPVQVQMDLQSPMKIEKPMQVPQKSPIKIEKPMQVLQESPTKIETPIQVRLECSKKNETSRQVSFASPEKNETSNPSILESPCFTASIQSSPGSLASLSPKQLKDRMQNSFVALERISTFSLASASPDFSQTFYQWMSPCVKDKRPCQEEVDLLMNSPLFKCLTRKPIATGTPSRKKTAKSVKTPSSPARSATRRAWRPSDLIKAKSTEKALKTVSKNPFKPKYNSPKESPKSLLQLPVASAQKPKGTDGTTKRSVTRKSMVEYQKLRKSFPKLMMTPVNTPVSRSRLNAGVLDSAAKTSRNVQAMLELLQDE